ALPGEPHPALLVEAERIEVHAARVGGQRPHLHRTGFRIDTHDRVLSAVGDPRCAIGANDDAMRRRARPERDLFELARLRIEDAELPGRLCRVIDRSSRPRRSRNVVRMRAMRYVEVWLRRAY